MRKLLADFDVREKAAVITVVILAWLGLNLAFAFLVNVPRAQQAVALEEAVSQTSGREAVVKRDVDRLREHYSRVMDGRTSLERFYSDVLSTKQERLIGFQKEIRGIAQRFNINMDTISYPREEFANKVAKFSATMPLTGSYENLREFIDTIENSQQFIVIESIQLANSKEGGVILSLGIQLSTYFVDPEIKEKDLPGGERRG